MGSIRIVGIDHVVLRCRDLERMERFYIDVLGCTVVRRNEPLGLIHLKAGSGLIDLAAVDGELGRRGGAAPGAEGHNLDHICLRVEPFDEAALRAHLSRQGIDAGPLHHTYGAEGVGPAIYLEDPEGNSVEIKGPPEH
ncbi:VOC family protein [Aphanothece minutissima]|uniref:VOC family virulence protein n=1 Tax=Aphanothece cf. minutissima CCALA 015 TaxID=2107695 RepID=A0ABX5F713_9CHRO|nr:VOC family protein [Aphanothece minutissima]PSB37351.1 VOC family virulence protein [Aphanothece cf. minutissima CCALA 015]